MEKKSMVEQTPSRRLNFSARGTLRGPDLGGQDPSQNRWIKGRKRGRRYSGEKEHFKHCTWFSYVDFRVGCPIETNKTSKVLVLSSLKLSHQRTPTRTRFVTRKGFPCLNLPRVSRRGPGPGTCVFWLVQTGDKERSPRGRTLGEEEIPQLNNIFPGT